MQPITQKQVHELNPVSEGEFAETILRLKEGDMFFISREEWKERKVKPPKLLNVGKYHPKSRLYNQHDVWVVTKKEGWVVGSGEKKI